MKWYLDVDGVINIVNHPDAPEWEQIPWPAAELREAVVHGFTIRWHPSVVRVINSFAADAPHEVVWLTTWQDLANTELSEPLGLTGPFRVLHNGNKLSDYSWWKAHALAADRNGDTEPFIWTDDDLVYSQRLEQHVQDAVDAAPKGSLMVSPKTHCGLTPDHLDEICRVAGLVIEERAS